MVMSLSSNASYKSLMLTYSSLPVAILEAVEDIELTRLFSLHVCIRSVVDPLFYFILS